MSMCLEVTAIIAAGISFWTSKSAFKYIPRSFVCFPTVKNTTPFTRCYGVLLEYISLRLRFSSHSDVDLTLT